MVIPDLRFAHVSSWRPLMLTLQAISLKFSLPIFHIWNNVPHKRYSYHIQFCVSIKSESFWGVLLSFLGSTSGSIGCRPAFFCSRRVFFVGKILSMDASTRSVTAWIYSLSTNWISNIIPKAHHPCGGTQNGPMNNKKVTSSCSAVAQRTYPSILRSSELFACTAGYEWSEHHLHRQRDHDNFLFPGFGYMLFGFSMIPA